MTSLNGNPRMWARVAGLPVGYGSGKRSRESIFTWPASSSDIDIHSQITSRPKDSQQCKGFGRRSSSSEVHTVTRATSSSETSGRNLRGENNGEINLIRLSTHYAIFSAETTFHEHDQSV